MSTTTCPNCRASVPAGNRFCTSCGHQFPGAAQPTPAAPQAHPHPAPQQAPPLSSGTWQPNGSTAARRIDGIGVRPSTRDAGMNGIRLAQGEHVERAYALKPRQRPLGSAQGTLVITNERVLYRADALTKVSRSGYIQEVHLRDVNGIALETKKGMTAKDFSRWMTLGIVWFFVFLLYAIFQGQSTSYSYYYGSSSSTDTGLVFSLAVVWLLGGALTFWLKWRSQLVDFVVRGAHGIEMPVRVSGGVSSMTVGSILTRLRPGANLLETLGLIDADAAAVGVDLDSAQAMYQDAGAVILDLQAAAKRAN